MRQWDASGDASPEPADAKIVLNFSRAASIAAASRLALLGGQHRALAHARRVVLQHLLDRRPIGLAERETAEQERRAAQPRIELLDQLRLALDLGEPRAVRRRQPVVEGARVEQEPALALEAEPGLDRAELHRLETGGRHQQVAEIQEVERRHGLEHVELLDQELEDLVDAVEAVHDAAEMLVGERIALEIRLDAVELVQDLAEPELVGLVHHDEQHLVVRRRALPRAFRHLRGEQRVELEIIGVVDRRHGGTASTVGGNGVHRSRARHALKIKPLPACHRKAAGNDVCGRHRTLGAERRRRPAWYSDGCHSTGTRS